MPYPRLGFWSAEFQKSSVKQNATSQGTAQQTEYLYFAAFPFLLHLKMKKIISEFSGYLGPRYVLNNSENPLVLHFTDVTDGNLKGNGNEYALGGISVHYIMSAELKGVRAVGKSRRLLSCCFYCPLRHCWENGNYPCCINEWQTNFKLTSADKYSGAADAVAT